MPLAVRDEPDAALEGRIRQPPLQHDHQTVPESDELEDVQEEPHEPGNWPGKVQPPDIRDRGSASNDRHVASARADLEAGLR